MQGTVKHVDVRSFVGMAVTKVVVTEFTVSLCFGVDKQLDIPTYWELIDMKSNTLIDRFLGMKVRENFFLYKLLKNRLVKFDKDPYQAVLFFEGDLKLIIQ